MRQMETIEEKSVEGTSVQLSYLDALVEAQVEEIERDGRVIVKGEDIAIYGGGRLVKRVPPDRI